MDRLFLPVLAVRLVLKRDWDKSDLETPGRIAAELNLFIKAKRLSSEAPKRTISGPGIPSREGGLLGPKTVKSSSTLKTCHDKQGKGDVAIHWGRRCRAQVV